MKSALLILLLLLSCGESRAAGRLAGFHPRIEATRSSDELIEVEISRLNTYLIGSVYRNIEACKLANPSADFTELDQIFGERKRAKDHRPYNLEQVALGRVPVDALPMIDTAKSTYKLEIAYQRVLDDCRGSAKVGAAYFEALYFDLAPVLTNRLTRTGSVVAINSFSSLSLGMQSFALDYASDSLDKAIGDQIGFQNAAWFSDFVYESFQQPHFSTHLRNALGRNSEQFAQILYESMYFMRPYRILIPGEEEANKTFPFIDHLGSLVFPRPEIKACVANLNSLTDEDFAALSAHSEISQTFADWYQMLEMRCPELSNEDRLANLSIEDRVSTFILPLSVLKAINFQLSVFGEGVYSDEQIDRIFGYAFDDAR